MKMVKIKSVWSYENQVYLRADEGIMYTFAASEATTTKDIRDKIKAALKEEHLRRKAMEEKTIDPKLKHLKELEGEEIE